MAQGRSGTTRRFPRKCLNEARRMELPFSYRLIAPQEQTTGVWSGGTTTELAIFPPGARYCDRNFAWRISTAVVTAAESTFTLLPGRQRRLMVLSGKMRLSHSGHHEVTLTPFEQDSFDGGWHTQCIGTGRDFNLMLAEGWQGSLQAVRLPAGGSIAVESPRPGATEGLYCLSGRARVVFPTAERLLLDAGSFLLIHHSPGDQGRAEVGAPAGPADVIRASIWRS